MESYKPTADDASNLRQECCNLKEYLEQKFETIESGLNSLDAQNTIMMEAISSLQVNVHKLLREEYTTPSMDYTFPIKSIRELRQLNDFITVYNREEYVNYMSKLLRGRLHKTVARVFTIDLIIALDIDVARWLKIYPKVFGVLMDALYSFVDGDPEKLLKEAWEIVRERAIGNDNA